MRAGCGATTRAGPSGASTQHCGGRVQPRTGKLPLKKQSDNKGQGLSPRVKVKLRLK